MTPILEPREINWVTSYQWMKMKNNYHIAIVISEFNKPITDQLLDGATRAFDSQSDGELTVVTVPGAFEIPGFVSEIIYYFPL
jgi:6,7-dimethyl-8-ribityllumazine synthase